MIFIIMLNIIINLLFILLITLRDLYLNWLHSKETILNLIRRFCIISIYNGHHKEQWFIFPCLREKEKYTDYYEVDLDLPDRSLLEKLMTCFIQPKPEPKPDLVEERYVDLLADLPSNFTSPPVIDYEEP